MQQVANEMNLSETAFSYPEPDGERRLRWFTPTTEVSLCGHATLATAHVMHETGLVGDDELIRFATQSGELTALVQSDVIELDFPATPPSTVAAPGGLPAALGGVEPRWVGASAFDLVVELATAGAVRTLSPSQELLARLPYRGIIVTARADTETYDFVSRFFAPSIGISEDPVTGAAHCALAPLWSERLGRESLRGFQASARGGEVVTELRGNRVLLRGSAVTVFTAKLARSAGLDASLV